MAQPTGGLVPRPSIINQENPPLDVATEQFDGGCSSPEVSRSQVTLVYAKWTKTCTIEVMLTDVQEGGIYCV